MKPHKHDKNPPAPCGCGQPDCGDIDAIIAKNRDKYASHKLREAIEKLTLEPKLAAEFEEHVKHVEKIERSNVSFMTVHTHIRRVMLEFRRRLISHKLVPREPNEMVPQKHGKG